MRYGNLSRQLMNLIFLLFEVISLGTSILCSQYIGAGRRDKVVQVVGSYILGISFGWEELHQIIT